MNLQQILAGPFRKAEAQCIARWVGNDEQRFSHLLDLMLGEDQRIASRAAWALSHCTDRYPTLILAHQRRLLLQLKQPKLSDAIKRNCLRMLSKEDLPRYLRGLAADLGFRYLADPKEKAAVRVFAMSLLGRLCRQVPELAPELLMTIEEYWDHASPAFRAHARKIRKALQ